MITEWLYRAADDIKLSRSYLQLALRDANALEGMLLLPLLEQSARLLQDLDALQSAVKADGQEAK